MEEDLLLKLKIKNEILKRLNLIEDYSIEVDIKNYESNKDGAICCDLVITQNIIPKNTADYINITFKV